MLNFLGGGHWRDVAGAFLLVPEAAVTVIGMEGRISSEGSDPIKSPECEFLDDLAALVNLIVSWSFRRDTAPLDYHLKLLCKLACPVTSYILSDS